MSPEHAVEPLHRMSMEGRALVNAVGTRRRIAALNAMGWNCRAIAGWLGHSPDYVARLIRPRTSTIRASRAEEIARAFEELRHLPPPRPARIPVGVRGGPKPQAWDGVDIDDPAAVPNVVEPDVDWVVVQRLINGEYPRPRFNDAEEYEAVRKLVEAGFGPVAIGRRLGISESSASSSVNRVRQEEVAA